MAHHGAESVSYEVDGLTDLAGEMRSSYSRARRPSPSYVLYNPGKVEALTWASLPSPHTGSYL